MADAKYVEEMVKGTIEAENETGIKIGERWCNWSKYQEYDRKPVTGEYVEVMVKGKFITRIGGQAAQAAQAAPKQAFTAPPQTNTASWPAAEPPPWVTPDRADPGPTPEPLFSGFSGGSSGGAKDALIVRQTCIKAAAEWTAGLGAQLGNPDPYAVIRVASLWAEYCLTGQTPNRGV